MVANKCDEEGEQIKARWCLQGHNDPVFYAKVMSGECHSPTLSQLARSLLLQLLVSRKWVMNLGDVKGTFLEAGPIPDKYRPLYAHQPPGGIPGVPADAVMEILGNLYGASDAPLQWYREFDAQAREAGFVKSMFDPCLYYFREAGEVSGVLGAHVDDTITGGRAQDITKRSSVCVSDFRIASGAQVPESFAAQCTRKIPRTLRSPFNKKHMPSVSGQSVCPNSVRGRETVLRLNKRSGLFEL